MASWRSEIKRREMFEAGVVYPVVTWGQIEIVGTVAPQLNLPK